MRRLSATAWVVAALAAALIGLLVFGLAANKDDKSIENAIAAGERPAAPGADRKLNVLGTDTKKSLADYRGQVVVLNFWGSWCDPCKAEAPVLNKAQQAFERDGSGTVLGATYDDATPDSLEFVKDYGIRYPSLRDVGTELAEQFGTRALPETFVLDRQGRIVSVSRGELKQQFLDRAIAEAKRSA